MFFQSKQPSAFGQVILSKYITAYGPSLGPTYASTPGRAPLCLTPYNPAVPRLIAIPRGVPIRESGPCCWAHGARSWRAPPLPLLLLLIPPFPAFVPEHRAANRTQNTPHHKGTTTGQQEENEARSPPPLFSLCFLPPFAPRSPTNRTHPPSFVSSLFPSALCAEIPPPNRTHPPPLFPLCFFSALCAEIRSSTPRRWRPQTL